MSHKKAGGSTSLGRDSQAQRLGTKLFAGQFAKVGSIIVRQRGTKIRPGQNVKRANDDSLFAVASGLVKFSQKKVKKFNGVLAWAKFVNVIPVKK